MPSNLPAGIARFPHLEPMDFQKRILSLPKGAFKLIDIRTSSEFADGHLPEAQLMDYYNNNFLPSLAALPRDKIYFIYCRTGKRTAITLSFMRQLDFFFAADLKGGIVAWQDSGFQLISSFKLTQKS